MKLTLIALSLALMLVIAACAPAQKAAEKPAAAPTEVAPVQDVSAGVSEVDTINEELGTGETDSAAGDLEQVTW